MSCSSDTFVVAPPPSPPPNDAYDADLLILGIVFCELAVVMIALGSGVQRFALTLVPRQRMCVGCISCSTALWIAGLLTYFGGNVVYTIALAFAPASLCAALMATVVVANAIISRILLKEKLQRCDYHGGMVIMAGIVLTAAFAPYVLVEYDAEDVRELFLAPAGFTYFCCIGVIISVLAFSVMRYERGEMLREQLRAQYPSLDSEALGPRSGQRVAIVVEDSARGTAKGASSDHASPEAPGYTQPALKASVLSEEHLSQAPDGSSPASAHLVPTPDPEAISGSALSTPRGSSAPASSAIRAPIRPGATGLDGASLGGRKEKRPHAGGSPRFGKPIAVDIGPLPEEPDRAVAGATSSCSVAETGVVITTPDSAGAADSSADAWTSLPAAANPDSATPPAVTAGISAADAPDSTLQPQQLRARSFSTHSVAVSEKGAGKAAAKPTSLELLMPFAYPVIIGCLETIVQMMMKGGSSMLLLTFSGNSQLCHATFWVVIILWAVTSLLVIWWLRKGLLHLPVTRLLPVEYGTVTSTSVIGGLVVYQEHQYVPAENLVIMGIGILLIVIGCALVGRRKTIKRKYMPGHVVAHRCLPMLFMNRPRRQRVQSRAGIREDDRGNKPREWHGCRAVCDAGSMSSPPEAIQSASQGPHLARGANS